MVIALSETVNVDDVIKSFIVIEREEFMQETQHTQQTATRKAQNQDKKQHDMCSIYHKYNRKRLKTQKVWFA